MPDNSTQDAAEPTAGNGDAAMNAEPDLTGQTLGDFRVLRRLGQGGMGQVFLAEQVSLKRHVALKLLKPELAANDASLKRFKQEAESVARVTHANIVQIYAIQETGGLHYMALEYVEGKNLREYLEKKGTPDVLLGLRIMTQVALALQRANELGIVHRDIKPENIMLTRKGEVKVADFGLSRCFDEQQPISLTQSNTTMGTPLYMSPEQVEGKRPVDHRSDIYSFGVTCYHMFAGHPPFRGTSPFEVAVQHVQKEPRPLCEIRPDLPPDLCAIIHKMMAKQPEARYQTARELLRDAGRLRDAVVVAGTTAVSGTFNLGIGESGATPLVGAMPARPASTWRKAVLVSLIPLAVGLGMAFGYFQQFNESSRPEGNGTNQPVAQDEPTPFKNTFSTVEQERLLLKNWHDSVNPGNPLDAAAALKHAIDLSLFYLKEKRYDDANKYFKELEQSSKMSYRALGDIGRATVLAFKDQSLESNKLFQTWLDRTDKTVERKLPTKLETFWRSSPALREIIAKALQRNHVNAPEQFPPQLEIYRHPPRPQVK